MKIQLRRIKNCLVWKFIYKILQKLIMFWSFYGNQIQIKKYNLDLNKKHKNTKQNQIQTQVNYNLIQTTIYLFQQLAQMNSYKKSQKFFRYFIYFIAIFAFSLPSQCNIWDNIFSQTQASAPITISQSFSFQFELPDQFDLEGKIDFNSQLKIVTFTVFKNILIQDLEIVKAQLDLSTLVVSVNQFLMGCQKYKLGLQSSIQSKVQSQIDKVNLSKKSLFLINLLFKYIGIYDISKNNGIANGIQNSEKNIENIGKSLIDAFSKRNLFDQLKEGKILDNIKNGGSSNAEKKLYNMFEFEPILYKGPKQIIDEYQKGKEKGERILDDILQDDFELPQFDLDELKFVLLTDRKTGQIYKAYKNKEMIQELKIELISKQKSRLTCKGDVKALTMNDVKDGAKFLYENKDTMRDVLKL